MILTLEASNYSNVLVGSFAAPYQFPLTGTVDLTPAKCHPSRVNRVCTLSRHHPKRRRQYRSKRQGHYRHASWAFTAVRQHHRSSLYSTTSLWERVIPAAARRGHRRRARRQRCLSLRRNFVRQITLLPTPCRGVSWCDRGDFTSSCSDDQPSSSG